MNVKRSPATEGERDAARTRKELVEAISLESRRSQNRTDAFDEAVADAIGINRTDLRCLDILEQEAGRRPGGSPS